MKADFFKQNRQRLLDRLEGGIAVFAGYAAMQAQGDASFPFRQEANFWYLTGIEEPDWQLIVDSTQGKSWLVSPQISDIKVVFDGGLAPAEAQRISGVEAVISQDEADQLLRRLAKNHSIVYGVEPEAYTEFHLNPAPRQLWRKLGRIFSGVRDCRLELERLRAIKQSDEVEAIKRAINLTIDAFEQVKLGLNSYKYEYEIEADFTHYFRSRGARGHAYDPIVAAAGNACTLHYSANGDRLRSRDLLLIDVGARLGGYAADITRTYAIGEPTKFGLAIHAEVEAAHRQIIELLKPGLAVKDYLDSVDIIMKQALERLGLISGGDDSAYRRYFPHSVSHGLGIDVHDPLGRPSEFKPGMVLTVEPGVYIPDKQIGVRLEDNILITDRGAMNLSARLSTACR